MIKPEKPETTLEDITDLSSSLQAKISKQEEGQRQRALMKLLKRKSKQSLSVDNDLKLINGKSLDIDRAVEVTSQIGLFDHDPEISPNHLTLLQDYLDKEKPSVKLKQINNINIVQTLKMSEPTGGPLLADLHALDY